MTSHDRSEELTEIGLVTADRASSVGVVMKQRLWVYWATVAFEREVEARIARLHEDPVTWETRASLQAITAVAFALECLADEVNPYTSIPADTKPGDGVASFVHEVLNKGFRFGALVGSGQLNRRLKQVFGSRRVGVHHRAKFRNLVDHPTGIRAAPENARYSLEQATEAVDTLGLILETCAAEVLGYRFLKPEDNK